MTDHAPLLAPHLEETQEDRLPVLLPVAEMPGATLYLGNRIAADDGALLLERGITSTMNLAVNIEMAPLTLADGTAVRRTHVGLIDGRGNTPPHLLGAALVLAGILGQESPGKSHYPPHRAGHVLVSKRSTDEQVSRTQHKQAQRPDREVGVPDLEIVTASVHAPAAGGNALHLCLT